MGFKRKLMQLASLRKVCIYLQLSGPKYRGKKFVDNRIALDR
jgi:hypothetical protein